MTALNNGMTVEPFAKQVVEARERVLQAATDALDAELERFIVPADRLAMLEDYAKFACFLAAVKIDEVRTAIGHPVDHRGALRAWYPLGKSLYREVPAMLLDYGREAEAARLKGAGDGMKSRSGEPRTAPSTRDRVGRSNSETP